MSYDSVGAQLGLQWVDTFTTEIFMYKDTCETISAFA